MIIKSTSIPDVLIIQPKIHKDNRGHFFESYKKTDFANNSLPTEFVQDNHSFSRETGTLRGLHFQAVPNAQAKLVRCGQGAIFDVAVDIRIGSPTYGQWAGYELSAENGNQLFIPVGFAHGFITLEPDSEIVYKCSDYYAPESEGAVQWNDPNIGIDWPSNKDPILSDKDAAAPLLSNLESPFIFGENS